jgi:S1-C subfamily serine protease
LKPSAGSWNDFLEERRFLVGRTTRGEQAWDEAEWVELQRTLRETLGDLRYEGLLYATGQASGVPLADLPRGSRAAEAGLQAWDQVLSYNGVQIHQREQLEDLTRGEFFERLVEIKVRHNDKTIEAFLIEPGPLGVHLTVTSRRSPCQDRDR